MASKHVTVPAYAKLQHLSTVARVRYSRNAVDARGELEPGAPDVRAKCCL